VRGTVFPPVDTLAFDPDRLARVDLGRNAVRVGAGVGIRYKTPVGFLRVDVAYKVNPGPFDLRPPIEVYEFLNGERDTFPDARFINRFRLHIGIGQAF
jgi:outer membrane protein insertion porin family